MNGLESVVEEKIQTGGERSGVLDVEQRPWMEIEPTGRVMLNIPAKPRTYFEPETGQSYLHSDVGQLSDPPPFDIDAYWAEWNKTQPIEAMATNHEGFSKVLFEVSRPYAMGYNTLSALNRGVASVFAHMDNIADFIEISGGGTKGGLFEKLAEISEQKADYWQKRVDQVGISFVEELVSEAVGGAVPGITQFVLDVGSGFTFPYMAGASRAYKKGENAFTAGITEAAKTATLSAIFKMMGPLEKYLKAPVMGTIFGLQEMEGSPEGQKTRAFAKGMGTGVLFSATTPGGKLGINEIYENAKPLLAKAKAMQEVGKEVLKSEKGTVIIPTPEMRETAYQQTVNKFASIENLDKKAEALGVTIRPGQSPGKRAREYLSIAEKVESVLEKETFIVKPDGTYQITGEGLKPIIDTYEKGSPEKNANKRTEEFNDYFISQRTIEDLQRPKGEWTEEEIVTPQQVQNAQAKLDALKGKYGNLKHFEAVADRLYDYQKRVLEILVDSGNLSQQQFDNIIKENPHYVPFDRVMDTIEPMVGGPKTKKPFTEARAPVKRIKGSEREVQDILGSIIKNTYRIMDAAERNTVANNIARLAKILPEDIELVKTPIRPIHVSPEEIDTITRSFVSEARQVKETVKKTGGIITPDQEGQSGPMKKLEKIVTDALQYRGMTEGEANVYLHKIKQAASGKEITGPSGTETIEKTINNIIKETVTVLEMPVESTIFRPSPYKPSGNTIEYYKNGKKKYMDVSDNLYSSMTGLNELSSDFLIKFLSFPAKSLRTGVTSTPEFMARNFIRDQFDAFIQSKTGFRPGIDSIGAIADIIGKTDVYYDWIRSGGAHSTFVDLGRKNLEQMTKHIRGDESALKYLNVINDAQQISLVIEQATRLGIYKAAIREGKTPVEAGFISREGTVDFGVHGESKGLKTFSGMTAFFNPAIQGTDRFIRAHKDNPLSTSAKAVASVTIHSVILWYINKDDPDYKELPRWQKDLFWMVKVGNKDDAVTWARIPKPFLYGQIYGSAPERFLTYLDTKDPKAVKDFAQTLIDSSTPAQGDPAGVFLPTAIKPLIENATNWSFFGEKPIVPQAKENLLPYMQYGKYTTETAKMIGKKLNWSPAKIENFVRGVSGGTGQYTLEGMDLALSMISGKEEKGKRPREWADVPLVKGFITRPVETDPQSLRDFYENAKEIDASYKSYRESLKTLDIKESEVIRKEYPKLLLYPSIESIRDSISNINKQVDLVSKSNSSEDDKRKSIRKLEQIRMKLAQTGNKLMEGKVRAEILDETNRQYWLKFLEETKLKGD